jgi:hypothetical protein
MPSSSTYLSPQNPSQIFVATHLSGKYEMKKKPFRVRILLVLAAQPLVRPGVDIMNPCQLYVISFFKKRLPGLGSEPGIFFISFIFSFHHFTAEPERLFSCT